MIPPEKEYDEPVIIPKVWELITEEDNQQRTHLVTKEISTYIRSLENDLLETRHMLANKIKDQNEEIKQEIVKKICQTLKCTLEEAEIKIANNEKDLTIVAVAYLLSKLKQSQTKTLTTKK